MSSGRIRTGRFTLALVLLACAQAQCEPPKFTLHFPNPGDQYLNTSSVTFAGQVEPPIQTDVRIQLYHVLGNGELLPEGGASRSLDAEGRFSLTLEPRAGGWKPGTLRCVVTAGSHLLRKSVDVDMRDRGIQATSIREPKDSGVVIDLSEIINDAPRVPAGERFRVRSPFVHAVGANQHQGPSVTVELLLPNPVGNRPIIAQADRALSFPADEFTCEFESEIVAPDRPGDYFLHVVIPTVDANGQQVDKHVDADLTIVAAQPGPQK